MYKVIKSGLIITATTFLSISYAEKFNDNEQALLDLVTNAYQANIQAIENLEIRYEMQRLKTEKAITDWKTVNEANSEKTLKTGKLGFSGNKLYNIESVNDSPPTKFVKKGKLTRLRPSDDKNYIAQSSRPGRLIQLTPNPWDVFGSGFTSRLAKNTGEYKVLSVEEIIVDGDKQIKITATKNLKTKTRPQKLKFEICYSQNNNYLPTHLESYIGNDPFGKAKVEEYYKVEDHGNIIYIPIKIEGFMKNPKGNIIAVRKYKVDKDSIRVNKVIPNEKFEMQVTDKDAIYDVDLGLTVKNPDGDINFLNEAINTSITPEGESTNIKDQKLTIDICKDVKIELCYVPPGKFKMGSPENQIGYSNFHRKHFNRLQPKDETPFHTVEIKNGFYIGQYEITNEQFRCFNPNYKPIKHSGIVVNKDKQPVFVDWFQARNFCQWLSKQTQMNIRLPSEVEWEYACRAGSQERFFWGNNPALACKFANVYDKSAENQWPGMAAGKEGTLFKCNDGFITTASVGSFLPNDFGLFDMIGNLPEWCREPYVQDAYSKYIKTGQFPEVREDENVEFRISRGGGFRNTLRFGRSAARWANPPETKTGVGFRVLATQN